MRSPVLAGLGLVCLLTGVVQVFALLGPAGRHGSNSGLAQSIVVGVLFTVGMLLLVLGGLG
jgi:hypothetical protein